MRQAFTAYLQNLGDPNIDNYLEEHAQAMLSKDFGRGRKKGSGHL